MKTIAICGSTGGIGQALARAYADSETRLLLAGRNQEVLTALQKELVAKKAQVEIDIFDVRDTERVRDWCQKAVNHGTTRLILAAGVSASVECVEQSNGERLYLPEALEDLERELNVNAVGNIIACNAFVRTLMTAYPQGTPPQHVQIGLISSLAGLTGLPGSPGYSASKAALRVYAEAMRRLTKGRNIGLTVLFPGFIESDMSRRYQGAKPWLMDATKGADIIKHAIESEKAEYAFPRILAIGIGLLNLLPRWIQSLFLKGFFFTVQPDQESRGIKRS